MKKFQKLTTLFMAIVMVFSLSIAVNAAEETGKLTITVAGDADSPAATAYQVIEFDADKGAWKLTDWAKTALGDSAGAALTALTTTDNSDSAAIAGYLTTLGNAASDGIAGELSDNDIAIDTTKIGGYLVVVTANNYTYTNMFVTNYSKEKGLIDATATAKGVKKQIIDEKKAEDKEVQVGDTIKYTVRGTIPHFEGTGDPKLEIVDTLSGNTKLKIAGTNIAKADIRIKVANEKLAETDYEVEATTTGFKVKFDQTYLSQNAKSIAGKSFTIEYDVTVTGYESGNTYTNTVNGTVNVTGAEERIPDVTEDVYTAAVEFTKVGANDAKKVLSGAQFRLSYVDNGDTKFVTVKGGTVTGTEDTPGENCLLTSDSNGKFSVKGLDPDTTYKITEVKAPTGYAKLADATISFKQDETDANKFTAIVDSTDEDGYKAGEIPAEIVTVTITDPTLGELPSTGGMGIMVVTVIGVAMMLFFGSTFMLLKKKNKA